MNHSLRRTMIAIPMAAAITLTGTTGALATKASAEPTTSAAGPAATAIGGGPEQVEGTPEQVQAAFEAINKRRAAQGVAPVKYNTVLSDTLFNDPPAGYTASGFGGAGAVAGDELDHAGVEAAVWIIDETPTEILADERWTHVGINLDYSTEYPVTYYAMVFFAYPADQSVPGTYASPEEAFADGVPPTPTPEPTEEPTPVPAVPAFADMDPDDNFYTEILWMAEQGISGGWATDDGKVYRPHEEVDRDVMAAFLYRLAGEPEFTAPAESPFVDITPESTFYKEMAWMAAQDISGGWAVGDGKEYRPHTAVDRDVMAAFLYRMAGEPEFTAPPESPFLDVEPGDTFYKEMAWMAAQDISGGWAVGDGKEYRPHTAVDRDVMAAFLYRLAPQLEG